MKFTPRDGYLFWCADQDGLHSWFVIAHSKKQAREFFQEQAGLPCPRVVFAASLTSRFPQRRARWATEDVLRKLRIDSDAYLYGQAGDVSMDEFEGDSFPDPIRWHIVNPECAFGCVCFRGDTA
jgi:hypothetical protein